MTDQNENGKHSQTLIIACHHDPGSLTLEVAKQIFEKLQKNQCRVELIDLYRDNFNPVFTAADQLAHNQMMELRGVSKYQKAIAMSKKLIFIFPLWWGGYPALLKGFIDRVFSHGFAYETTGSRVSGLLTYLTVDVIFLMDNDGGKYEEKHLISAIKNINQHIIYGFCGCQFGKLLFIDNICLSTSAKIKQKVDRIVQNYNVESLNKNT